MSLTNFLSKSRGPGNLVARIRSILSRFSVSSAKYEDLLRRYSDITRQAGLKPTLPITAVTLKRHPGLIRELCQQGVEFAVHGYIHTDYNVLSMTEQKRHYKKAVDIFKDCQIPFTGFRAPFIRVNDNTLRALRDLGFFYDSSSAVHWEVINKGKFARNSWAEYERVLDYYKPRQAQHCLALPRSFDGIIEIPLSMPDDEIMVDRLGITDKGEISDIWMAILDKTYSLGELFTIQLHPERILYCESALLNVIREAHKLKPSVWVASLQEIADWWREKDRFDFKIRHLGDNTYGVQADCSDRATILLKNCKANVPVKEWFDGYQSIADRDFVIESPKRPVIGVGRDSSSAAIKFLKSEGYIIEPGTESDNCEIYLGDLKQFNETDEKRLSREIESSGAPLLRYWRWPDQARSACSITGDIDSITLIDFVLRIFENWRQGVRCQVTQRC